MRFKQAGFLTKLVIVVLLIYMATSLLDLREQIQGVQAQRDELAPPQGEIYKEDISVAYGVWCWVHLGWKSNGDHEIRRLRGAAGGALRPGPHLGDRVLLRQ